MSPAELQIPERFGAYRIVRRIAIGGMAEIYLAKTEGVAGFERHLVLKVIHPKFANDQEFIDMLVREAKLVVRLNHVNIAQVFDLGKQHDRYYIAMEYVDGLDVYQFLKRLRERRKPMPFEVASYLLAEVCSGLHYAHERRDEDGAPLSIIHRDISPQNVLLSYSGDVKIIDFGIAKARARAHTTGVGIIKGKFSYMSPEQAQGDSLDHRSDIFAVGVLFYELLTNRMLYDGASARDALRMAKAGRFLPPSTHREDLPGDLEQIVLKALARDRRDRYQSGNEMHEALSEWLRRNSPGYGRHRLERFVRGVCEVDQQSVSSLGRGDYAVQPAKSVIFEDGPRPEPSPSRDPNQATVHAVKQRKSKPPPMPDSKTTGAQVPLALARTETVDSAFAATLDPEDPPRRNASASTMEQPRLRGKQLRVSDEPDDQTVDLFSAPTAVVHLPSVPSYDIYSSPTEASNPGHASDPFATIDTGKQDSERVYSEVRKALAERREAVRSAENPIPDLAESEAVKPGLGKKDTVEIQASAVSSSGVEVAWKVSRDELARHGPPTRNLSPPSVTKIPPPPAPPDEDDTAVMAASRIQQFETAPAPVPRRGPPPALGAEPESGVQAPARVSTGPPLPTARPGRRWGMFLIVCLALTAATIAVWVLVSGQHTSTATGAVYVDSRPVQGAEILLDGEPVGARTPAVISGLAVGASYQIGAQHADFGVGTAPDVRVVEDEQIELVIELIIPTGQ